MGCALSRSAPAAKGPAGTASSSKEGILFVGPPFRIEPRKEGDLFVRCKTRPTPLGESPSVAVLLNDLDMTIAKESGGEELPLAA